MLLAMMILHFLGFTSISKIPSISALTTLTTPLNIPLQTQALRDSQSSQAPGSRSAAGEPAGERLQHQPDAAVLTEPALLQPQHQGETSSSLWALSTPLSALPACHLTQTLSSPSLRRTTLTLRLSARRSPPTAIRATSATQCFVPSQKYVVRRARLTHASLPPGEMCQNSAGIFFFQIAGRT